MQIVLRISLVLLLQAITGIQPADPLNKSVEQVIAMRGKQFRKMTDASGHHMLQYKTPVENDPRYGNYTIAEFLYFNRDTCFEDVTMLPTAMEQHFIDSFNRQFQPTIFHTWMRQDSSIISIAVRDGFLDVTSYTSVYAKDPF